MSNSLNSSVDPSDLDPVKRAIESTVQRAGRAAANDVEETLWNGGYSPKAMIGTWLLSIILSAIIVAAAILLPKQFNYDVDQRILWSVAGGILGFWWITAIGTYLYRRWGTNYQLTTQRFIHTHGLLVRTTDRIEVIDIDDVTFSQGIVERILGVGKISLASSDRTHPFLLLIGIDDVHRVSGLIDDTRRKERRRRSVHIEAV